MPNRYVFMPPDLMRRMTEDLRQVANIPVEDLERLAESLQEQTGFLTDESLVKLVAKCVDDESQGAAVFNVLKNLRPAVLEEVVEMVEAWREADEDNAQQFSDEAVAALRGKLPILVRDYPAMTRMKKAERLRGAIGDKLEDFAFICDARPIYDESRERIDGLIPLTTMKLVYERQSEVTEEIELVLTDDQLEELISQGRKAQQKLNVLRKSIAEWVPDGCVDAEG